MSNPAIELAQIGRTFTQGGAKLEILREVSLVVEPGQIVALTGPSGAGKSTLLQIAGLLERPTTGDVLVGGQSCDGLDDDARTEMRRNRLGFVYQYHHLLPEFSALENIMLPQMIAGLTKRDATERAHDLLAMVGLKARAGHRPARLSGGEQQRVALARGLANAPSVLIADEPTGNLDQHTADAVFNALLRIVRETGVAALIATHNMALAARMDRILELQDGLVVET